MSGLLYSRSVSPREREADYSEVTVSHGVVFSSFSRCLHHRYVIIRFSAN